MIRYRKWLRREVPVGIKSWQQHLEMISRLLSHMPPLICRCRADNNLLSLQMGSKDSKSANPDKTSNNERTASFRQHNADGGMSLANMVRRSQILCVGTKRQELCARCFVLRDEKYFDRSKLITNNMYMFNQAHLSKPRGLITKLFLRCGPSAVVVIV